MVSQPTIQNQELTTRELLGLALANYEKVEARYDAQMTEELAATDIFSYDELRSYREEELSGFAEFLAGISRKLLNELDAAEAAAQAVTRECPGRLHMGDTLEDDGTHKTGVCDFCQRRVQLDPIWNTPLQHSVTISIR